MQDSINLKQKMVESDKCSQSVKERDYKYHREQYYRLIARLGIKFTEKSPNLKLNTKKKQAAEFTSISRATIEEDPLILIDKYEVILPELNTENIDNFINIFSDIGINSINNNYLGLFRFFHSLKYK